MWIPSTYAVAIIIEGVLSVIFGVDYLQPPGAVCQHVHLLAFYLPYISDVLGFLLALALIGVLYYIPVSDHFGRG